mmetsp:Transcript_17545/g.15385  ORF Transcript_17545/g.15385 Transcript_17545/m.15385 type:complete len:124 (+) Transcript_17545:2416-2787(+)
MTLKKNFDGDFDEYMTHTLNMNYPFTFMKNDKNFPSVLRTALDIVNFINFGTNKGNAPGFTLDVFGSLDSLKGYDKKTNINYLLVKSIKESDESYLSFVNDFARFDKATRFEVGDFEKKQKEF